MAQQQTPAAGSGKPTLTDLQRYEIGELSNGPALLADIDQARGSSSTAWDNTPRVAKFIASARKTIGFSLLGWRFEAYREPTEKPCPQCGGYGMWRPPYARERVPCDLCTSAPISQASATTSASPQPSANNA